MAGSAFIRHGLPNPLKWELTHFGAGFLRRGKAARDASAHMRGWNDQRASTATSSTTTPYVA